MQFFRIEAVDIITRKAKSLQRFCKFLHGDFRHAGESFVSLESIFPHDFAVKVITVPVFINREITFGPLAEIVGHIPEILTEYDITHLRLDLDLQRSDGKIKFHALEYEIYIRLPLGFGVCAAEQVFVKVCADLTGFEIVVIFCTLVVIVGEAFPARNPGSYTIDKALSTPDIPFPVWPVSALPQRISDCSPA